jgi:hypothetical protein
MLLPLLLNNLLGVPGIPTEPPVVRTGGGRSSNKQYIDYQLEEGRVNFELAKKRKHQQEMEVLAIIHASVNIL